MEGANFVGRQPELAWLRERLRLAARGDPQCVLLSGEPGIGKTRLAFELVAEAQRDGFLTLVGRGYEGVLLPFVCFLETIFPSLETLLDDGDGPPMALKIARGASSVDTPGVDPIAAAASDRDRPTALLLELAEEITHAARRRPLLLVLDDLHWADSTSLALIRLVVYRLASARTPTPLCIVGAARPDPVLTPLRREHRCALLELPSLDRIESADLARRLGSDRTMPDAIWGQTHGNPLLIEWTVLNAKSSPLRPADGRGVPDVSALFDTQLADLSALCLDVLATAALLVPDLTIETLRRLGRWSGDEIATSADEAVMSGVLERDARVLRFTHPLLRERFLAGMGPMARERAHAEIASALGPPDGSALATVARHLVLAGAHAEPDTTARLAVAAGRRASVLCAWEEAAWFLEAALALQDRCAQPLPPEDQAALLIEAGTCRQFVPDSEESLAHFDRAAILAREAGDLRGEIAARERALSVRLGVVGSVASDEVDGLRRLALSAEASCPAEVVAALTGISDVEWTSGDLDQAAGTIARALEIAEQSATPVPTWRTYHSRAMTRWLVLDLPGALADLDRVDGGDPRRQVVAAYWRPLTLLWMGRFADASAAANRAMQLSEQFGSLYEVGLVLAAQVMLALHHGDMTSAEYNVDRALRIHALSGYQWPLGLFLPTIAFARLDRGDATGALGALSTWEQVGGPGSRTYAGLLRLLIDARGGALGPEVLDRIPAPAGEPRLGVQDYAVVVIELARLLDRPDAARPAVEMLEATLARGMQVSSGLPVFLARAAADGHHLLGADDKARRLYGEVIRAATAAGAQRDVAMARLGLARLDATDQPRIAAAELRRAIPNLERLSLVNPALEAAALADQLSSGRTAPLPAPEHGPVPTATAVLFLDVVDSTRLNQELGDVRYRELARAFDQRLRLVVAEHRGEALPGITLGDGLVALFGDPEAALAAAFAAIHAGRGGVLRLHAALHHGRVLRERDGGFGHTMNVAARICDLTAPDEVLVSDAFRRASAGAGGSAAYVDRGRHRLRGVVEPQQVFAAVPRMARLHA